MKTQLIEKNYRIIERDESGLIPDWAEGVLYYPNKDGHKIQFYRREYESIGGPQTGLQNLPDGNDRKKWKEFNEKENNLLKKLFPSLTSEEVQKIVEHLEGSLIDD